MRNCRHRRSQSAARDYAYKNLGDTRAKQVLTLLKASPVPMTLTQLGNRIGADTMGLGGPLLALEKKGIIKRVPNFGPRKGFGWAIAIEPIAELLRDVLAIENKNPVQSAIDGMRKLLAKKRRATCPKN